ncbi:hypothetical protein VUR80DRAFT_6674 [Thermomyces stellatus]
MNSVAIASLLCLLGLAARHDVHQHPYYRRQDDSTTTIKATSTQHVVVTISEPETATPASTSSPSSTRDASAQPTTDCSALMAQVTASPTLQPALANYSTSYYETHARTAAEPERDCGWITDLPGDFRVRVVEWWWRDFTEWRFNNSAPVEHPDGGEMWTTSSRARRRIQTASRVLRSIMTTSWAWVLLAGRTSRTMKMAMAMAMRRVMLYLQFPEILVS